MKRHFVLFLAMLCCVACLLTAVYAGEENGLCSVVSTKRIDLKDGGYIIEEITEDSSANVRATSTKTGSKTSTRYDSNNTAIFAVKVTGTFSYTGSSSSATSSTATVYIYTVPMPVMSANLQAIVETPQRQQVKYLIWGAHFRKR